MLQNSFRGTLRNTMFYNQENVVAGNYFYHMAANQITAIQM